MAVLMIQQLFSEETHMSSNVAGRKKKQLYPILFAKRPFFFPRAHLDTFKEWAERVIASDESSRRLKNKLVKHLSKLIRTLLNLPLILTIDVDLVLSIDYTLTLT